MPKSEVVRACGYVSSRKDGSERLNYTSFYEALLEAKGMSFGGAGESTSRKDSVGRKLSYIAKVHFNGNLLVGKAYTSVLGLKPGDEFDIKLERKGIRLIPKHRSGDMIANASSVPATGAELDVPKESSTPISPVPLLELETLTSASAPDRSSASPSAPMEKPPTAPAVAPAPIPAPVAAPAAPPAPGIPQPEPVAAATPEPRTPAPKPASKSPSLDSWEDSLRKLDQSSRPERWDA